MRYEYTKSVGENSHGSNKIICEICGSFYFYKIDTITDLPINEYVNRYPADGFIENYCLSSEELMRVKLYRKQLN